MSTPPPDEPSANEDPAPPSIPDHTLLHRIGAGSYGEVWLARNVMGALRAVKLVYRRSFASDRPYEREFAGLQKFEPISRRHESQLDILHIGRNDALGCFYYVMELADAGAEAGEKVGKRESQPAHSRLSPSLSRFPTCPPANYSPRTLRSELQQHGRLPVAECVRLGLTLATALEHLHSHGLVHRDIKPSNIVFVEGQPKLADIGLVTDADATMSCVGTDGYLPPEGPGAPQADLFALGKVLYEISTGRDRKEFPGLPTDFSWLPDETKDELREFNAIVLKSCQPRAADRYPSAAALRDALLLLQAGKSVRRQQTLERQLARVRIWGAWTLAVLTLLVCGLLIWQSQKLAETRGARRQLLLNEVQMARQGTRTNGWFHASWDKLREAARLKVDDDVRTQAAACLSGLDMKLVGAVTNAGAFSLAYSPDGQTLLCAGVTDRTGTNAARLWCLGLRQSSAALSSGDPRTNDNTLDVVSQSGRGLPHSKTFGPTNAFAEIIPLPVFGDAVAAWKPDGTTNGTPVLFQPGDSNNFVLRDAKTGRVLSDLPLAGNPWQGNENHPVLALTPDAVLAAASVTFTNDSHSLSPIGAEGWGEGATASNFAKTSNLATPSTGHFAVWDTATGRALFQTNEPASALAFSPDGRALAVGDSEGRVRVFSVPDFVLLAEFPSARVRIHCFAFTRDPIVPRTGLLTNAWWLAVGDSDGTIRILRTATREQISICRSSVYDVFALGFHSDGVTLGSAGRREILFWDAATGGEPLLRAQREPRFNQVPDYVRAFTFSSDGNRFALGNEKVFQSQFICEWELNRHRGVRMLRGLSATALRVRFSQDGQWLAALASDWQLGMWELSSGRLQWVFGTPRGITADNAGIAFSLDGASLAFSAGSTVVQWNLKNGSIEREWVLPSGFSDDLTYDRENRLWLLRNDRVTESEGGIRWTLRLMDESLHGEIRHRQDDQYDWLANKKMAVIPDRECFIVSGLDRDRPFWRIKCYDLTNGSLLWSHRNQPDGHDFKRDPGDHYLIHWDDDNEVAVKRELPSGTQLAELPLLQHPGLGSAMFAFGHGDGYGMTVAFSRSSSAPAIVMGADYRNAPHDTPPFSRDGRRLAWGTERGGVLVADWEEVRRRLRELHLDPSAP